MKEETPVQVSLQERVDRALERYAGPTPIANTVDLALYKAAVEDLEFFRRRSLALELALDRQCSVAAGKHFKSLKDELVREAMDELGYIE